MVFGGESSLPGYERALESGSMARVGSGLPQNSWPMGSEGHGPWQ